MNGNAIKKVDPGAMNSFLTKEPNMWNEIRNHRLGEDAHKWVRANEAGRITGRIHLKDGEYRASRLSFDADGLGNKNYLGAFVTLEQAKAAVDALHAIQERPGQLPAVNVRPVLPNGERIEA